MLPRQPVWDVPAGSMIVDRGCPAPAPDADWRVTAIAVDPVQESNVRLSLDGPCPLGLHRRWNRGATETWIRMLPRETAPKGGTGGAAGAAGGARVVIAKAIRTPATLVSGRAPVRRIGMARALSPEVSA